MLTPAFNNNKKRIKNAFQLKRNTQKVLPTSIFAWSIWTIASENNSLNYVLLIEKCSSW